MTQYCINHPTKLGRSKCRYCGAHICRECKIEKPHGTFCSEKCAQAFSQVNQTVSQNDQIELKQKRGVPKPVIWLIYLIILLVIVYFGLKSAANIDLLDFLN